MWIQDCHVRYPEVLHRKTKKPVRLKELEAAILELTGGKHIVPEALALIERGHHWPYPDWWPQLSSELKSAIPLPAQLKSWDEQEKAVKDLLAPLKHIEVVSILLRFTCPEEFGIMSPPVLGLLAIVPLRDSVEQYLRYLLALRRLRDCYQGRCGLKNIADYDMALWTASHLEGPDDALRVRDEMIQDEDFQQIRLGNLMEGLGYQWRASIHGRLLLAGALLHQDHPAAAVIVARCYEQIMQKAAKLVGMAIVYGRKENPVERQLTVIEDKLRRRRTNPGELASWWRLRRKAVHGDENPRTGDLSEISWKDTKTFLAGVQKLADVFRDSPPPE